MRGNIRLACLGLCGAWCAVSFAQKSPGSALEGELLADASGRASFQSAGATAGHDGRFFVASSDGDFRLSVSGEVQFRYLSSFDADTEGGDDAVTGFQLHRTRLDFRGNVIDPKLTYRFLTNFNREDGTLELQDAYGEYELEGGAKVRWGQFKLPFDREFYVTSATTTLSMERSLVSSVFRLDRSQGVQLGREWDRLRLTGALSDGRRALNTAYYDEVEGDIALTGRAEVRLGEAGWKQFRDQTAFRGDASGALLGMGGHWQQDGSTGAPSDAGDDPDLFAFTADAGYESDGWNVLGAVVGRVIDWEGGDFTDWGVVAQGGVFLSERAELFARLAEVFPDGDRSGGDDDFSAITAGVNWYFVPKSHAAKLTAELTWYPDTQADSASIVKAPESGIILSPDEDGGQLGFGVQMQLIF